MQTCRNKTAATTAVNQYSKYLQSHCQRNMYKSIFINLFSFYACQWDLYIALRGRKWINKINRLFVCQLFSGILLEWHKYILSIVYIWRTYVLLTMYGSLRKLMNRWNICMVKYGVNVFIHTHPQLLKYKRLLRKCNSSIFIATFSLKTIALSKD